MTNTPTPPPTARQEVDAVLARGDLDPTIGELLLVLVTRIEKQAEAIVKLQQSVSMLDRRTVGLVRCR